LHLHGLLRKEQVDTLRQMMPGCLIIQAGNTLGEKKVRGRCHDFTYDHQLNLEFGNAADKQNRYQELLVAMIKDQWSWIRDHSVVRTIDASNAVESLRLAETAREVAGHF
jgi:hypothetical protein